MGFGALDAQNEVVWTRAALERISNEIQRAETSPSHTPSPLGVAHASLRAVLELCRSQIEEKELAVTTSLRASQHHIWRDPARIQTLQEVIERFAS